jgi:hypothetical protein
MNNVTKLTVTIIYGLTLSACGGGGDNNSNTNVSGSIGACFTAASVVNYTVAAVSGNGNTMKISVGPGAFKGQASSMVETFYSSTGTGKTYWVVKSDGVYMLGDSWNDVTGSTDTCAPKSPWMVVPLNMQSGQIFDDKLGGSETCSSGEEVQITPSRTTFIGFETITLAGRTFSGICHFRGQDFTNEGKIDPNLVAEDIWFAPGYGRIKFIANDGSVWQYSGDTSK